MTLVGVGFALAGGHRLWVGRLVNNRGDWPPVAARAEAPNRLNRLLMTATVFVLLAALGAGEMLWPGAVSRWVALPLFFAAPVLLALGRDAVAARVAADAPADGWPDERVASSADGERG